MLFAMTLKEAHKNGKWDLSFDSRVFLFSTRLDPVLMPERNTNAPPRWVLPLGFFLLDSRLARSVDCAGMLLTKKDRQ